jgi:hypothetical protein
MFLLQQKFKLKNEKEKQKTMPCEVAASMALFKEKNIMAKVKKEIIEAAMIKLIDNITATMPNTTYKFLLGGAAGILSLGGIEKNQRNNINV